MMRCRNRIYGAEFSAKEIEETAAGSGLLSMEIEFNRECNFNCIYCYVQNDSNGREELTMEESRDVIMQAGELGAKKIIILGGEPMLYPHIMEMIRFIKEFGMEIELFTNGTNITQSAAKTLSDSGVVVVLKMNSLDENLQDVFSGSKGAYKYIQEAFNNLREAGYPHTTPLGISTIICRRNIDELVEMWQWMRDQKITPYIEMITPQGRASENGLLEVEPHRVKELFYRIARIDREKYGCSWNPQPPLVGGQCLRHRFSCVVNAYGDVLPCVGVTIPVGNIREGGLSDILKDSEVIRDLRNYKKTIKGPCGRCENRNECYGCRGAAYQVTGDYLASDPSCWKNLDKQDEIIRLPLKASRLVPHKPPMLIVDELTEVSERSSVSELRIPEDSILIEDDGKIGDVFYLEMVAQSVAALNGFKNMKNGESSIKGFLLGIKNLEILGGASAGDKLRVRTCEVAKLDEFGIVKGEVFKGDDLIARGEIKVWHSNEANES
ncbi:MAG TPA: radical SAM protein [Nitrospirae bacterium]|nr:radical SAM protein [Nitrospirota bacterium]